MSYNSEYYQAHREKLLEKNKAWRKMHREQLNAKKRAYESRPDRKIKKREKSAHDYLANRNLYLAKQAKRRKERRDFLNAVCEYYGCRNPECKWQGKLLACQLDFHHFDPEEKLIEVAKMDSWSYDKIIAEIDKCVVVCRDCHPLVHMGAVTLTEEMKCKSSVYLERINQCLKVSMKP